jgi:predicted peroxiredoxin
VSDDPASKTIIMCNHGDATSMLAALVMAAAAAATGEQVLMFFQPGAAKALVKGELEKFQGIKGQPDPVKLYESIEILDGRIILCELGLPIHDIAEEDLRDGVEIMMASSFLFEAEGANMIFSY